MRRLVAVCEKIGKLGGESAENETGIAEEVASLIHDLRLDKSMTNSIGLEMLLIPSGSFIIWHESTTESGIRFISPLHQVIISRPFYLGKYPVTQEQWEAVMESNPSNFKGRTNPVENVSWDDAQEFIKRLNAREGHNRYRLPTEMEWEYAALGGTDTLDFFGESPEEWERSLGDYVWFRHNSGGTTHPVGRKKPNPYGLYDIYGNVREWVQDWDAELPKDEELTDYRGPATGFGRMYRGGSWYDSYGGYFQPTFRIDFSPVDRRSHTGFRLALSLE
jgi:formylglycine-generating enzyme required for sulfatase activity